MSLTGHRRACFTLPAHPQPPHTPLDARAAPPPQVFAEGVEGDANEPAGGAVAPEMLLSFDEFRAIMEDHDVS